jgi:hypothetical protein
MLIGFEANQSHKLIKGKLGACKCLLLLLLLQQQHQTLQAPCTAANVALSSAMELPLNLLQAELLHTLEASGQLPCVKLCKAGLS